MVAGTANGVVMVVFSGSVVARVSKPKTLVALVSFDLSLCRIGYREDREVAGVTRPPCHRRRAVLLAGLLSYSLFLLASLSLSWCWVTTGFELQL